MSAVLKFDHALNTIDCATCCMTFAVPSRFMSDRRNDHKDFYCPQGHVNVYRSKSEAEKLRDELAQKERELEWERGRVKSWRNQSETNERRLRATKRVLTRTKNRVAKGVCPCCNRTFANLHRHMTTQHPDYASVEQQESI